MAILHETNELGLGTADVFNRLTIDGLRQEADEVAGMTCRQGHSDLAVMLHSADTGSMAGARIEHDEGPLLRIDLEARRRRYVHQAVVHRPVEIPCVGDQVEREIEHIRRALGFMREMIVAAAPQGVEKEHAALPGIDPILEKVEATERARR